MPYYALRTDIQQVCLMAVIRLADLNRFLVIAAISFSRRTGIAAVYLDRYWDDQYPKSGLKDPGRDLDAKARNHERGQGKDSEENRADKPHFLCVFLGRELQKDDGQDKRRKFQKNDDVGKHCIPPIEFVKQRKTASGHPCPQTRTPGKGSGIKKTGAACLCLYSSSGFDAVNGLTETHRRQ